MDALSHRRIIRNPEYARVSGLSRSTRWRLEKRGVLPARIKITEKLSGWWLDEVLSALEKLPRVGAEK